ncbi:hypothetical protein AAEX28_00040 [Lentisphaerota bacterium WC36G]|nr:hypothetical protein LJT99_02915 [Lentisphaerae bacterium WC36]
MGHWCINFNISYHNIVMKIYNSSDWEKTSAVVVSSRKTSSSDNDNCSVEIVYKYKK